MILVESKVAENKTHLETIAERPPSQLEKINSRKFSVKRQLRQAEEQTRNKNRPKSCDLRIKKIKKIDNNRQHLGDITTLTH